MWLHAAIFADVAVTDPARYEHDRMPTPAAAAAFGGRFVVRGGETVPLEGGRTPSRIVIDEFPTLEAARTFCDSPDYREGTARMRLIALKRV